MLSEEEQISDARTMQKFFRQNLKTILAVTFTGGLVGLLLSFFIPKEFLSVGNVYPPFNPSIEASIDNPNFGYDVEADRLIQILQSNELRDSVNKKFDLVKHYGISKNDPQWIDQLSKRFKKEIFFERTPAMSILIKAQTTDPQLSSDIVNFIISTTDAIRERLYKQNIKIAYDIALADFNKHKQRNDSAERLLVTDLRAKNLNSLLILASNAQLSIDFEKLNSVSLQNNSDLGSEIIAYKNIRERMNESENRFIRVQKAYLNPIPRLYVIDKAEPRYKKVFPSYLIMAASGMIFSFAAFCIVILAKQFFAGN